MSKSILHKLRTTRRDAAILQLCASLFAEPDRIQQALTHPIDGSWVIAPHAHENLLQFDLLEHCAGQAVVGKKKWSTLRGTTAMVAMPTQTHGYELGPEPGNNGPGRVYHIRFRLDPSQAEQIRGAFPALITELTGITALIAAMRVVIRLGAVEDVRPPMLIARLAEAMCLWPGGATATDAAPYAEPERHERGMSAALDLIEKRLADPPSIDELAAVAHFSVRHFSRRFQSAMGCTPHTYITARRFALARQVLSQDRLKINEVANQLGFGSVATFSRWFSQQAGISPSKFREDPAIM